MVDRWNHSGCFTLHSFKFLIVKCVRRSPYTSIFSLDYSRDGTFLNLKRVTRFSAAGVTSDKGDQMTLRTYCLRGDKVLAK